jgi:outer membrane receptor protein involved in Fe transport
MLSFVANAQFRAGVQGVVTDNSGSVIPGATVTLTNKETNQSQQTESSEGGFYRFTGLAPGLYSISAEKQDFKKGVVNDVKVDAEVTNGVDVTLEAGVISETVTVTDDGAQLPTEDANVRKTITTAEILRLPQAGRDPYELARLTPGVFGAGARGSGGASVGLPNTTGPGGSNSSIFQTENQVPISANGQRVSANNFQIDGVSVNSQSWGGAALITPSQESVKEVQVSSSTYSAEDGRNSGAVIKVVSKNGTNDFHGSAFFRYLGPELNAYNKFPTNRQKVLTKFKNFGGSVGGPIWKDKLFFFFTYEGGRSQNAVPADAWVETPQFRQLVRTLRPNGVTAAIFGATGVEPRISTVLPRTCADLGIGNCQNVTGGLDLGSPTGALRTYVDGFSPSMGGGFDGIPDIQFVRLSVPSSFKGEQFNTRFDWNVTHKDSLTVSAYFTPTDSTGADTGAKSRPMADIISKRTNYSATLLYNRIISSSMFNEFRVNMNRFSYNEIESNPDVNFGIPRVEVEGYPFDRIRFGADRSEATPGIFKESGFEIRNVFNMVIGNSNFKFGAEVRRETNDNSIIGGARPLYSFVGLWNLANDAPIFEAVNADPTTGAGAPGQRNYASNNYAFFIQDDWKFLPNVTVNLGLRWEYFSPLHDKSGQQSNLFLGPIGVVDAQVRPVDQLYKGDWNNFGPQVGVAWSPEGLKGKGVIRGGFGMGYNRMPNSVFLNSRGNPPFFARFGICCGNPGDPFVGGRILYALGSSNSPTSYPANPVLGQGINPTTGTPVGGAVEVYGAPQDFPTANVVRYSVEGQYELPFKLVSTLGYQGSSGRDFTRLVNLNFVYPQINGAAFNAIFFPTPDVTTKYDGVNARLQRRFANGFQIDAIYRWSKSVDQMSYEGPGFVTNQTYPPDNLSENGPSDFDVRHYAVVSGLWDIPFFRKGNSWAHKLLGGWQLNGIYTAHSGFPWTVKVGPGIRGPGGAFFGPIRPITYNGLGQSSNTNADFLGDGVFAGAFLPNTNCGQAPGCNSGFATYINGDPSYLANPPAIGRNTFRGPKYRSMDLSVVKRFRLDGLPGLREGAGLDLRANFFNVFNQLNLANFGFGDDNTFADRSAFGKALNGLAGRTVELQARFNF